MPAAVLLQSACSQFNHSVDSIIGRLCSLEKAGAKTVVTAIITTETLVKIAAHNELSRKLPQDITNGQTDPIEAYRVTAQIKALITGQEIPKDVAKELLGIYHSKLKKGFVDIRIDVATPHELDHTNIQGDANFIESILHIWADAAVAAYQVHSKQKKAYIAPGPIIIQSLPQATASGVISTRDTQSSNPALMVVYSTWGVSDSVHHTTLHHRFTVDTRTLQIVDREQVTQTIQLIRDEERFDQISVPKKHQSIASLTDAQVVALVKAAHSFKKHILHQMTISWQLVDGEFVFSDWSIMHVQDVASHPKAIQKLATHIYTIASDSHSKTLRQESGGIGLFKSDDIFMQLGEHPHALLASRKKKLLKDTLKRAIRSHLDGPLRQPLWYRSMNLTTNELQMLKKGDVLEQSDINPFLGYRGALRAIHSPDVFEFELEVLDEVLKNSPTTIGLILPFVRTPSELHALVNKVVEAGLTRHSAFELWMQVNTPENLINLSSYHLPHIKGFLINIGTIQACLFGIDPDNVDIHGYYQTNFETCVSLIQEGLANLTQVAQTLGRPNIPKIRLYLNQYHSQLVETAVKLHLDGVVVKPEQVPLVKTRIEQLELESLEKTQ